MNRKAITYMVVMLFVVMTAMPAVYASGGYESSGGKAGDMGAPVNSTCPILGTKIDKDTPYKMQYKGKTIGFCCAGCPGTFKKNPEKYEGNL